jgi:hypothetical protein
MYAQVLESSAPSDRLEELDLMIRAELVPALRAEEGFSGVLCLLDRAGASALVFVFWETEEEAARPLAPCSRTFIPCLPAVWEVGARG